MKTIRTTTLALACLSSLVLVGCQTDEGMDDYDQATLERFKGAVPTLDKLEAAAPEASAMNLVGDPALYPTTSYNIVIGINGAVTGIIGLMDTIVDTVPPTLYNSATHEFLWGPFPNDDGAGYVAVYIREANGDFRYEYALMRGEGNDLANMTPVIWGGATPDENNEDYGVGVTLWDFEANYQFDLANDPDAANQDHDRGRFVALYGKGADENAPENEIAIVYAVFRNFIPQDNPTADPADLDYLYGRYSATDTNVDFLDWEAGIDVDEPQDGTIEDVGVRMAFVNEGMGRAEAVAAGGSLPAGTQATGVECWDNALGRQYLQFEVTGGQTYTEGELVNCDLFQATLDELQIPSLDDIDPGLRAILDQVAENGAP